MGDFFRAIIEFFTDFFSAFAEFFGSGSPFGDIVSDLGSLGDILPEA